jgi:hypothetical protein
MDPQPDGLVRAFHLDDERSVAVSGKQIHSGIHWLRIAARAAAIRLQQARCHRVAARAPAERLAQRNAKLLEFNSGAKVFERNAAGEVQVEE